MISALVKRREVHEPRLASISKGPKLWASSSARLAELVAEHIKARAADLAARASDERGAHNYRQRAVVEAHGTTPVEFWADDRVGKSTIALHAAAATGMLGEADARNVREIASRGVHFSITSGELEEAPPLRVLAEAQTSPEAAPPSGRRVGIAYSTLPGPVWAGARVENGVSTVIHELGHIVMDAGAPAVDALLGKKIEAAYASACEEGTYDKNAYILKDTKEYWACGTQAWFDVGHDDSRFSHNNGMQTRKAVKKRDPALASLMAETYGDGDWRPDVAMDGRLILLGGVAAAMVFASFPSSRKVIGGGLVLGVAAACVP